MSVIVKWKLLQTRSKASLMLLLHYTRKFIAILRSYYVHLPIHKTWNSNVRFLTFKTKKKSVVLRKSSDLQPSISLMFNYLHCLNIKRSSPNEQLIQLNKSRFETFKISIKITSNYCYHLSKLPCPTDFFLNSSTCVPFERFFRPFLVRSYRYVIAHLLIHVFRSLSLLVIYLFICTGKYPFFLFCSTSSYDQTL